MTPGRNEQNTSPNRQPPTTTRRQNKSRRQKTRIAAPTLRGKSRREGVHNRRSPPDRYNHDFATECNEEPTQDWQRRWNVGSIQRHNKRHKDDPKPLPQWINESPDKYATLRRPLPDSNQDRIYIYDSDYHCNPWDQPDINDTESLTFKIHVKNPPPPEEVMTKLPEPPSPILKKTKNLPDR